MTTEHLVLRNRANAQKSTGPRSKGGKARVARNARRHGATSRPDPRLVAAWMQVILNAPDLSPADMLAEDPRMQAALALAEAEARLCAAQHALDQFERGEAPPTVQAETLMDVLERIRGVLLDLDMDCTDDDMTEGLGHIQKLRKCIAQDTELGGCEHRLRKRYVREARSQRRKAFQRWGLLRADQTR